MEIDFAFPHEYEVNEVGDYPGDGKFGSPVFFYPVPENRIRNGASWLRIKARGSEPWIGAFAFGDTSPSALSRVVSTPDPRRLCVISNGAAYVVSVDEPHVWDEIYIFPVLDARPVVSHGLLLLSDFTHIAAYGVAALAWKSPRVCWDDLKIANVTPDTVEGAGYDPTNSLSPAMRFVVDLKTGRSLLPAPVSGDGKPVW
jgi:hypothetical protein